jgi:hypothetical protein
MRLRPPTVALKKSPVSKRHGPRVSKPSYISNILEVG